MTVASRFIFNDRTQCANRIFGVGFGELQSDLRTLLGTKSHNGQHVHAIDPHVVFHQFNLVVKTQSSLSQFAGLGASKFDIIESA